ncbi:MAG: ATP-binding protein, partial [Actinomycetota bacterium]|nr:ATP-binding protein [Actinomycetota bacterium]
LDEGGGVLVPRAARGLEEELERGIRIPVGAGFAGRIAAERRPLALADIRKAEIFNPLLIEKGIRSMLGVPLLVEGRVTGVLHVGTLTPRDFSDADAQLLQAVADRTALAIEHARLYEAERDARREAERRASAALALDYVGDGVFLIDRDGAIRFWNPAAELIFGVPIEAALGRRMGDVVAGWAQIESVVPLTRFPAPPATVAKTVAVEVDGAERWLSISGVSFRDGTVYAFRDVTDQRRLEEWQSEFIATVAHEFRTPMASVYGAAATLRRQDVRLSEETRDSLLSIVYDESERLARLVDDVLVASRLEAGKLKLALTRFDPAELARRVIDAARAHVKAPVEIALATPEETPPAAGDPDKVKHVLVNLVENAVKYSPDGGRVEVRLEPRDRHIRVAVADQGLGIPEHECENVFRKFYRLDSHAERGIGGTGLGLYICRELLKRMDGRIWLSSREGEGSTFYFELPLAAENGGHDADVGVLTA